MKHPEQITLEECIANAPDSMTKANKDLLHVKTCKACEKRLEVNDENFHHYFDTYNQKRFFSKCKPCRIEYSYNIRRRKAIKAKPQDYSYCSLNCTSIFFNWTNSRKGKKLERCPDCDSDIFIQLDTVSNETLHELINEIYKLK